MFKILCVTNRRLCKGDLLERIKALAACHVDGIILREKDLPEREYYELAKKAQKICVRAEMPLILHSFYQSARGLGVKSIHFPLSILKEAGDLSGFSAIGASCHSLEDAREAEKLGCSYITAGHIFETDCKAGIAGRGTAFLSDICKSISLPVYAIGGITPENLCEVLSAKVTGICVMSGAMTSPDIEKYILSFREAI